MSRIADWLRALDLGQYAQAFAAQDIDIDLLPDLTPEDLTEIGVTSVGHRRRILSAARRLAPHPPTGPGPEAGPEPGLEPGPVPRPGPGGEQRPITAMFCDLVDSTGLSSVLDPEDYRDLIDRVRALVSQALAAHDGQVARFLGDGIVAFFGLDRIEEHTAQNAVAAALATVQRIRDLPPIAGRTIEMRIGIATGMTVVDAPDAPHPARGDGVIGEIPNLAARLQAVAPPGAIVLSHATRTRLGGLFRLEDLGHLTLKGVPAPHRAWRVLGHAETDSRFDALRGRAGFVGRAAELALIERQSALARNGRGRVTLISGDSGMGKSRLAREGLAAAGHDPARVPVLQCSPYHQGSPFEPLRRYLSRRLRRDGSDPAQLSAALGLAGPDIEALLSDLIGTPSAARKAQDAPPIGREARIDGLGRVLLALAADDGALILEDAQWLDPSTADLLRWIVARLDGTPLHLVATLRSGSRPDWAEAAGAAMVPLGPLAPDEFAALIRTVARDHAAEAVIGAAQIASIAARCDGSPVFAEELTRFALETGDAEALPASLADSLLARLDRLPAGRRLAQVGAVIGTEFPQALLQAVAGLDDAALRRDIAALIDAGILRKGDSDFGPAVAFRHMLLHDAAYMTLLRRDRVALHARTAQVMQREVPHIADALPQVLAHHLSRGGAPAEAARHWERAGTLAARRSAYAEAIGHFRQALTEIETAGADTVLDPLELSVRLNLVAGLIATEGFGAPTVRAEMPRVEALGQALDRSDLLVPLRVSKWIFLGATGQFRASLHVARQLNGETGEIAQLLALRALGTSLIFCGRFSEAKPPLEAFVARYDPSRHAAALSRFGVSNHAVMTAVGLAELAVIAQDRAAADRWGALAETYAQDSGTAHDRCNVTLFIGCILPALQGHHESLPVAADRLRALARDHALPLWHGYADLFDGIAAMHLAPADQAACGAERARQGIARIRDSAAFLSFCMIFHADACLARGRIAEARDSLALAGSALRDDAHWLSAEMRRIDAMIAAAEGAPPAAVAAALDAADALAARQGAPLFRARIAASRGPHAPDTSRTGA